ncbi:hypothetical protein NPIL_691571, partial [Nephila pilipes]
STSLCDWSIICPKCVVMSILLEDLPVIDVAKKKWLYHNVKNWDMKLVKLLQKKVEVCSAQMTGSVEGLKSFFLAFHAT